jgi:hypothetical protein
MPVAAAAANAELTAAGPLGLLLLLLPVPLLPMPLLLSVPMLLALPLPDALLLPLPPLLPAPALLAALGSVTAFVLSAGAVWVASEWSQATWVGCRV